MVATRPRSRRPRALPFAASRRRWSSVSRRRLPPSCSLRMQFSSTRYSITWAWCRLSEAGEGGEEELEREEFGHCTRIVGRSTGGRKSSGRSAVFRVSKVRPTIRTPRGSPPATRKFASSFGSRTILWVFKEAGTIKTVVPCHRVEVRGQTHAELLPRAKQRSIENSLPPVIVMQTTVSRPRARAARSWFRCIRSESGSAHSCNGNSFSSSGGPARPLPVYRSTILLWPTAPPTKERPPAGSSVFCSH